MSHQHLLQIWNTMLVVDGTDGHGCIWDIISECTPVTDYFSYANRLWTVGSADVTGV